MQNKRVIYKSVRAEGFQSFGSPVIFSFDRTGINLIKGVNGAGKSTLFNAMLWAEFGINLKKSVETWDENKPENYKGTRVIVVRSDGVHDYMIARHANFKGTTKGLSGKDRLMIFKKSCDDAEFSQDHLLSDGQHKSQMQDIIVDQLGIDSKTYMNSVFFGQRMSGLINASNTEKRDLFEQLFDVAFVDGAREKAKEKQLSLTNQLYKLDLDAKAASAKVEGFKEQIEKNNELVKNFDRLKLEKIASLVEKLDELTDTVKKSKLNLKAHKKELGSLELTAYSSLSDLLAAKRRDVAQLKAVRHGVENSQDQWSNQKKKAAMKIAGYQTDLDNVDENCPVCKSPLDAVEVKDSKKAIQNLIKRENDVTKEADKALLTQKKTLSEMSELIAVGEKARDTIQQNLDSHQTVYDRSVELERLISKFNLSVEGTEYNITSTKDAIAEKRSEEPLLSITNDELETKIKENLDAVELLLLKGKERQDDIDHLDWWIKKGFGSSGLKAFVFNAMLNQLNQYAAQYAARMGLGVEFSVDMTKASKPFQTLVYKDDIVRDYMDLSGGQKQRVDMVIAFAMHDLVSYKADINILVMDEIFEGLDAEGVETAFDLIRRKAETKSVFLITHNEIIDSLQSKSIYIALDDLNNSHIQA